LSREKSDLRGDPGSAPDALRHRLLKQDKILFLKTIKPQP
jgi:hypothetical protein